MASRQMRKLRKQQELLNLEKEAVEGHDESEDEPAPQAKPRGNVFSGFAALGDLGDDDDDGDDDKSDEGEPQQTPQKDEIPEPTPAKKTKKSKKKKKGKKAELSVPTKEDPEPLDEIDQALEELKLAESRQVDAAAAHATADASAGPLRELFQINFQHLKAINEMRKLFGKVMESADAEGAQESRTRGARRDVDLETYLSAQTGFVGGQGQSSKPAMFDSVLRTNPFIEGKKTWPRDSALGLKMACMTNDRAEVAEYAFCHDERYDVLESSFFRLVQMYDPMQIVHFLYRHPYHVSSLIQVSKVAKQDQNSALAADLIERALFTFGRVGLKDFRKKLEQGRVMMDFARPENRQFFLAGWHLIQHLVLKGTYRTALEWAKLFLGINHEDPYAMINWIHVLAIRAYQAQWFVDLCNTKLLDETEGIPASLYAKQTLPLAYLQLEDPTRAKTSVIEGIERAPWLYGALFKALNLDTPKSIWGVQPRNDDEELYTHVYIHMAKDLWNNPQAIALLVEAANAAQKTAPNTLPASQPVSLGTARFIYLGNTPDLMSAVPRQMLHASPNFDFDPLPPARADNKFSSPNQEIPWLPSARGAGLAALTDARVRDIFAGGGGMGGAGILRHGLGGDGDEIEDDQADFEAQLAHMAHEAEAGNIPTDRRGFLGRVLDMMMPHLMPGVGGRSGVSDEDEEEEEENIDDEIAIYAGINYGDFPDYDPHDYDESEPDDDDTDDNPPDLEDIPAVNHPSSQAPVGDVPVAHRAGLQAQVEDVSDSDEELSGLAENGTSQRPGPRTR
ncbi:transcriptional repressor TCF25-domain-containing protein [Lasiosphaeria hispida]|uniref:Transcriptional repressor TCF25-domain-containing protein n=1 Tax=Lasiosphaeria hispida TaxID=260671 RepID=A0AAJ0H9R6_9PEZI|nr:transcriptional repressor TCF25-domain-containing protein [Lasiosphaeria hispida]